MVDSLKEIRQSIGYTQQQAADYLKVSLRSYKSYENEPDKVGTVKYSYLVDMLGKLNTIDETHGILDIDAIKDKCEKVFSDYQIEYCYLFGSYAKWTAKDTSDVDLLISTKTKGIKFFEMAERLREALQKKVDLLDTRQVLNNQSLLDEVLKYGIRIYG